MTRKALSQPVRPGAKRRRFDEEFRREAVQMMLDGHTAASVALFGGLLLLLASRIENTALRAALWIAAVAIPAFVIWARLLRGMHHATDVTAGVLMGLGALVVVVFAARAAGAAAAQRDRDERDAELASRGTTAPTEGLA